MEFNINARFSLTDVAAWWGAVVATALFIWDIIKWIISGPKIIFTVWPNQIVMGDPVREGKTYINANVINRGTQPTTLRNLGLLFYKTRWRKFKHKADQAMIITNPNMHFPIPYLLEPGKVWNGLILQNNEVENMAKEGILEVSLSCSHLKKDLLRRVLIPDKKLS